MRQRGMRQLPGFPCGNGHDDLVYFVSALAQLGRMAYDACSLNHFNYGVA
jgi:ribosomal protein L27